MTWAEAWGLPNHFVTLRPPVGFVAGKDKKLIIAFMTQTDAGVASLTNLVGDPKALIEDRRDGAKKIMAAMEKEAKSRGFKVLSVSTKMDSVEQNLLSQGYLLMEKELKVLGKQL